MCQLPDRFNPCLFIWWFDIIHIFALCCLHHYYHWFLDFDFDDEYFFDDECFFDGFSFLAWTSFNHFHLFHFWYLHQMILLCWLNLLYQWSSSNNSSKYMYIFINFFTYLLVSSWIHSDLLSIYKYIYFKYNNLTIKKNQ